MKKTGKGFGLGKGLMVLGLAGLAVGALSHKLSKKNMIEVTSDVDEEDFEEDFEEEESEEE